MKSVLRVACCVLALAAVICRGQDISPGATFTDGQRLTAAELSQLVSQATLQPQAITGKPNETSVASGDYFLVYNAAANALYKVSGQVLLTGNTALVTSQPEKAPITNDFVFGYDSTGQTLVKMQLINLWSNGIADFPVVPTTNLSLGAFFHVLQGTTNGQTAISNLFAIFPYTQPFTNLPVRSAPTNWDNLVLAGSQDNTNFTMYRISLAQLFTNLPTETVPTNGDRVLVWTSNTNALDPFGTNPFVASVPVQDIGPRTLVFSNLPDVGGYLINTNLIFPAPPQVRVVLVVTNTSFGWGYQTNDELDASRPTGVANTGWFTWGSSATNTWAAAMISSANHVFTIPPRFGTNSNTAGISADATNFNCKVYVTYFPIGP